MSSENDKPPIIKLAQPGYDVKTAGDEHLIYSSAWPMLKIYRQGSYKTQNILTNQLILEHDLGFVPFFWYFTNIPINAWQNFGNYGIEPRSEFMGPINLKMTDKKLTMQSQGSGGPGQLYYYIFALDLTKDYTAPIIKQGAPTGPRGLDHVFKIAKEGKDVSSDNLFDFVIHSRARSPLIHSVSPSPGAVKSFSVEHKLGYLPIFFAFQKNADGSYSPIYTGQGGATSLLSTENTVTFNTTGTAEVTIVILKDPFLLNETVSIKV